MATMFQLVPADPETGPPSGIDRHIEDFREFFRSRGVSFGSADDLPPFVARVGADASFRDDMASLVRTAIYRERDGFSRLELVDLVAGAVGGPEVEQAEQPEIREAVRQVMAFVESVFRTRWNPGAPSESRTAGAEHAGPALVDPSGDQPAEPAPVLVEEPTREVVAEDAEAGQPEQSALQNHVQPHATTDLFYRAQVVAGAEPAEAIAQERKLEKANAEPAVHVHLEHGHESFRAGEARARPAVESRPAAEYEALSPRAESIDEIEPAKKTSRFWIWTAAVCALLLAFCAGLVVHQRLLVPLRAPNQPYEKPPADTAPEVTAEQARAAGQAASAAPTRGRRRAEEARSRPSVRHGAAERAREESAAPVSRAAGPSRAAAANDVAAATKPVEPADRTTASVAERPATHASAGLASPANLQPRYMAPAMIGASPALMASHLVYAPPPDYPMLAQISHIRGRVLVEAVVGRSGRVIRAEAISGHRLLRGAAVHEVYERRYKPYLLNDRPTDVATIVSVDFGTK